MKPFSPCPYAGCRNSQRTCAPARSPWPSSWAHPNESAGVAQWKQQCGALLIETVGFWLKTQNRTSTHASRTWYLVHMSHPHDTKTTTPGVAQQQCGRVSCDSFFFFLHHFVQPISTSYARCDLLGCQWSWSQMSLLPPYTTCLRFYRAECWVHSTFPPLVLSDRILPIHALFFTLELWGFEEDSFTRVRTLCLWCYVMIS